MTAREQPNLVAGVSAAVGGSDRHLLHLHHYSSPFTVVLKEEPISRPGGYIGFQVYEFHMTPPDTPHLKHALGQR